MNKILNELGYSQLERVSDYKKDISDYNTVIKNLIDNKVINKDNNNTGLIPLTDFFELNECSDEYYKFLSREEALKLIEKDNLEYYSGDNTYNHGGFLERDLNFEIFNKVDSDEIYVFFRVHTGGDIMYGYSNYFVMHFDDNETLDEFLTSIFSLKEIETTTILVEIDGEACADYTNIYIVDINDVSKQLIDDMEVYIPTPLDDTNSKILTDLKELYPDLDFGELVEK